MILAGAATGIVLLVPGALTQVGVIVFGAAIGWLVGRGQSISSGEIEPETNLHRRRHGAIALIVFVTLLVALPLMSRGIESRQLAAIDGFYRAGALVFGGGHVVLPLLREEVVPKGWVSDDEFLAGYGAAQALPGPLFAFAGYVGAAMGQGVNRWMMGVLCLLAIFLPAWLLIGGALPFWRRLRAKTWAQAALRGANAAVVGLLLAALWRPVIVEAVHDWRDALAAAIAMLLLMLKVPVVCVVAALALTGQWWLAQASW
jgi:chromate transporter